MHRSLSIASLALGALLFGGGDLHAQQHARAHRQPGGRPERLAHRGERLQREAWRLEQRSDRLRAQGHGRAARKLDVAAERRMRDGRMMERKGRALERRRDRLGWI